MTARFSSERSLVRQSLMAAAGLVLLLAALDVVSLHKLSDPPTTDDNGVITSKGQTERRTDLAWGTLFVVVGGALVVVGISGLLTRRPVIELTDDELRLRVAGPMTMLDVPWSEIVAIRAGREYEDQGRIPIPQLLVEVEDPTVFPPELWGAVWDGNTLRVDADGWESTVDDVVIRSEMILERPVEGSGE